MSWSVWPRVLRYMSRTRRVWGDTSRRVQFLVGMGLSTVTFTSAGRTIKAWLGRASAALCMTIGTMGTPAALARLEEELWRGPPAARVDEVRPIAAESPLPEAGFEIRF